MRTSTIRPFAFMLGIPAAIIAIGVILFLYTKVELLLGTSLQKYDCSGLMPLFCQNTTPGGHTLSTFVILTYALSYNSPLLIPFRNIIFQYNHSVVTLLGSLIGLAGYSLIIDGVRYVLHSRVKTEK